MKKSFRIAWVSTILLCLLCTYQSFGQRNSTKRQQQTSGEERKEYREGHVWFISMIKTKPGMTEDYIKGLKKTLRRMNDEAVRQGLLLSYKILTGISANGTDWDVLILEEYRDMASLDGLDDRMKPILQKYVGDDQMRKELMQSRTDIRSIYGEKIMREVVFE